jgi:hypothetical protein
MKSPPLLHTKSHFLQITPYSCTVPGLVSKTAEVWNPVSSSRSEEIIYEIYLGEGFVYDLISATPSVE